MVNTTVFQIVGFKNSGKTTLIKNLIHLLTDQQIEVAVLKHHGHGGIPDIGENDSEQHFSAGAAASMVEGAGTIQLLSRMSKNEPPSVPALLGVLRFFEPHVILIEGYKREIYPKVVLIKEESDLKLLNELDNIQAVIAWPDCYQKAANLVSKPIPIFHLGESDFYDWFLNEYCQ